MKGDVAFAELSYIVRDHDRASFESRLNRLRTLEVEINQKYGNTVIMVTHNDAIKNMADRVVKLRDGQIRKNYVNETKIAAADLEW